jgi:pyridoxine 5-phosphate synthase
MTKLSVNINKFATLRNARGGNNPDILKVAIDIQKFGADGITIHPRPDERHIKYSDARALQSIIHTEFNIEGNPKEQSFIDLVMEIKPTQVTLVPDSIGQLTSNHGWDTIAHQSFLKNTIAMFKNQGIRVSIFVDPVLKMIAAAATTGADRIELYTESFANEAAKIEMIGTHNINKILVLDSFIEAAKLATKLGLGINAGHDLDIHNLKAFATTIPNLKEVSIGHALVCDAIYLGLENTIQMYKRQLM